MRSVRDELKVAETSGFTTEKTASLLYSTSKKVARIDQNLLQDSYDLYLHFIVLDEKNRWSIIQQGLNSSSRLARRYHWSWASRQSEIYIRISSRMRIMGMYQES